MAGVEVEPQLRVYAFEGALGRVEEGEFVEAWVGGHQGFDVVRSRGGFGGGERDECGAVMVVG